MWKYQEVQEVEYQLPYRLHKIISRVVKYKRIQDKMENRRPERRNAISVLSQKNAPKEDDIIRYKASEDAEWKEAVVLSRAGKQSAKSNTSNKFCVNIQPSEGGET